MKSNGFGSWGQRIIVEVRSDSAETARKQLGGTILGVDEDTGLTLIEWGRATTRKGMDEDVVFDAFMFLGNPDELSWNIRWESSDY